MSLIGWIKSNLIATILIVLLILGIVASLTYGSIENGIRQRKINKLEKINSELLQEHEKALGLIDSLKIDFAYQEAKYQKEKEILISQFAQRKISTNEKIEDFKNGDADLHAYLRNEFPEYRAKYPDYYGTSSQTDTNRAN